MSHSIDWYFDFISPFAYFQHHCLIHEYAEIEINYHPVLFGALLQENNHKGPADIPAKRIMTYRYCNWYAEQNNIPFRFPDVHPYRPVAVLRLVLAAGVDSASVKKTFDYIWIEGKSPFGDERLQELATVLGMSDPARAIADDAVKEQLRINTQRAIELGIFGVPTIVIDNQLFWGRDHTDMALDFLHNPALFQTDGYRRLESIPDGLRR